MVVIVNAPSDPGPVFSRSTSMIGKCIYFTAIALTRNDPTVT